MHRSWSWTGTAGGICQFHGLYEGIVDACDADVKLMGGYYNEMLCCVDETDYTTLLEWVQNTITSVPKGR